VPSRPCIVCGILITTGSRCDACKPARQLNGWAWTQTKQAVVERDGYACTECGSTRELEVHHLRPLRLGGTDDLENLVTLCAVCHLAAA
jgi:5-methylcytosine-specific restriction endonuclease McrA